MRGLRRRACLLGLGTAAVLVLAVPGGVARATTLNGDWAPYNRCPVTNSSMLAADGATIFGECLASNSPGGSMTLGNTTVALGNSNLQVGVLVNTSTGTTTAVAPSGGAIVADPVNVPGGLLGLMCPTNVIAVSALCDEITNSTLNAVTATIVPAGQPSALSLGAGFSKDKPIITVPVMIQLSNPILGSSCFIGSDSDPIVLTPENSVPPSHSGAGFFDPDGTPDSSGVLVSETLSGGTMVDDSFSVPGASGCGPLGIADPVLDLKEGLPASSGNSITLDDPTLNLAGYTSPSSFAPNEGQDLAAAWESAEG